MYILVLNKFSISAEVVSLIILKIVVTEFCLLAYYRKDEQNSDAEIEKIIKLTNLVDIGNFLKTIS